MITNRTKDVNGFYEVARNPLSKVGVFPYTKKSIGYPGWENDPGGIVQVYRPASELGDPETVKSFRLLPWVDDHAMLGDPAMDPSLTPVEKKGAHGTIGEQVEFDPNDGTLYGNIKLWSSSLADAVEAGKKELSMGFRCVYEFVAGIFEGAPFQAIQRTIRGNHQASVDHGRMGPGVAVLDHFVFALDASELKEIKPMAKVARRVNVAAKLGVAVAALPAFFGMDAADIDPKALAKFNAVMDAEEDKAEATDDTSGSGGDMTISEAAEVIADVAAPLSELQDALASLAGGTDPDADPNVVADDDMEPVVDAAGQPVMDAVTGKPKMTPKVKAVASDATVAACDAAVKVAKATSKRMHKVFPKTKPAGLAAMDSAITKTEKTMTNIRTARSTPRTGTGLDARVAALETTRTPSVADTMREIATRDRLASRVSAFVGTFDHAEMDAVGVATYAAGKFGITVKPETAVASVEAYLHNRQPEAIPAAAQRFGMDSAPAARSDISGFISGRAPAAS